MGATGWELVDLVARWIHVIAAIMWVGNSLLFNWLDRNLQAPGQRSAPGSLGEIWLLHSGAFYYVDKTLLGDQKMPRPLHWFFVQALTTWGSGFVLLVAVYWVGGRAAMTDTAVATLSQLQAVMIGVGCVFGGALAYEIANRFIAPRASRAAAVFWIASLAAIAFALTQLLNGRAAFLHVGAMLGTIMAMNVAQTILPSQRELVASVNEGRGANSEVSARAKRVSIHNNYFVFPVIVLMLTSHFPSLYGNRFNWFLLLVLVVTGVAIRHIMNIRFTWKLWRIALAGTSAVGLLFLYAIMRMGLVDAETSGRIVPISDSGTVNFADVRHVIDRRCAACHSSQPTDMNSGIAPGGVAFDTPEQIMAKASRIMERAVVTRTMPPGNKTGITAAERAVLARGLSAAVLK